MRHEDKGDAKCPLDFFELNLHLFAKLEVEGTEGFVKQQDLGFDHGRACEGDTLSLTTGELRWLAIAEPAESNRVECSSGTLVALFFLHSANAKTVGHVFEHRHMRKQCVVLEHRVHVAIERRLCGDVVTKEFDFS